MNLTYPDDFDVCWSGREELLPPRPQHSVMEQYNQLFTLERYEAKDLRKLSSQGLKFKLIVMRPRRKQHYVRSK